MKINFKKTVKTIFAAAVISTVFITAGCQKDSEPTEATITLRFGHTATNSDGLIGLVGAAKELGYMEEELSKVNATFENIPFIKAGPAINSALASNELDMATLGDVPAVLAKSQGADTVLLDVFYSDYKTDLVVRSDLDINDITELKGKKVAVQTGSYMQRILYQILEEAGIAPEDVEIVNMSEVDAGTAVAAGSIDASPVTSVKGSKLSLAGDAKILYSTRGDNQKAALSVIIGRSEFADEHPEVVEAFFKALIRASEATETDKSVLRDLYIKSGIEEEVIDDAFKEPEDYNNSVGGSEELLDNYQYVSDFLKEYGFADNAVDIREWYDRSFYEKAAS